MSGNRFADFSTPHPTDALFDREFRAQNDANGNAIYIGYCKSGSATSDSNWLIKKFTYDGNNAVTWSQIAGDNLSFSHVWDDRASLF